MKRRLKNIFKRNLHGLFKNGQRLGFNILPNHFYSQIPNISELNDEEYWRKPLTMVGVRGINDLESQAAFIEEVCGNDRNEQLNNLHARAVRLNGEDGGYGEVESDFLFYFICRHKPPKIVQIGCGVSTALIRMAAAHVGYDPEVVCAEPYPTKFITELHNKGEIVLHREKAQKVNLEILTNLERGDMLFIDSTHTVKPGSEVNRIIFEVLPRLKSDVWVHFHDIYYPYDYQRRLLTETLFFWSESSLLHAFLIDNSKFTVVLCQSMMHYNKPEVLSNAIVTYDPQENADGLKTGEGKHFPSSIYLKTVT